MSYQYIDKWEPVIVSGRELYCDGCGWWTVMNVNDTTDNLGNCRYCEHSLRIATQADLDRLFPNGAQLMAEVADV